MDKVIHKPVDNSVEKPVENFIHSPVDNPVDNFIHNPGDIFGLWINLWITRGGASPNSTNFFKNEPNFYFLNSNT